MVNTFVVNNDFEISSKKLDYRRLGKQRVEAKQILDICEKFQRWSKYYNLPLDKWVANNQTLIKSQMDNILFQVKRDLKNNIVHFYDSLNKEWILLDHIPSLKIPCSRKWTLNDNNNIIFGKKTHQRFDVKLPDDIIGTTGFVSHPIVKMWIGFKNCLSHYINCNIQEWVRRGYKNNMSLIEITGEIVYPSWINEETFDIHKTMLLQKEIQREEKEWYINFDDFVHVYNQNTEFGTTEFGWTWF